jgi:hypothetical protein
MAGLASTSRWAQAHSSNKTNSAAAVLNRLFSGIRPFIIHFTMPVAWL